jgi:hypothetical protein
MPSDHCGAAQAMAPLDDDDGCPRVYRHSFLLASPLLAVRLSLADVSSLLRKATFPRPVHPLVSAALPHVHPAHAKGHRQRAGKRGSHDQNAPQRDADRQCSSNCRNAGSYP